MKRTLFLFSVILFVASLCSCNLTGKDESGTNKKNNSNSKQLVTFNVQNAKAVGKLENQTKRAVYRADETETEETQYFPGDVVIILEDGNVGAFIQDVKLDFLPAVNNVFYNPVDSIKDIYVLFERPTTTYYDKNGNPIPFELGQLLRVKQDGTYDDIFSLIEDTETTKYISVYSNSYMKEPSNSSGSRMDFDVNGNLYFIVEEEVNSISTSIIYKYDPVNNTAKSMSVSAPNMRYDTFQITGDGTFMFVSGTSGNSTSFLRAIDIANPELYENLAYRDVPYYYYDNKTEYLYLTGGVNGFSRLKKSSDNKYLEKNIEALSYDLLFPSITPNDILISYPVTTVNNEYDTEAILKEIFTRMYGDNYSSVDLRFDKFAEIKQYKSLATKTAGKKNEEALNIILEDECLRGLLFNIISCNAISSSNSSQYPDSLMEPKNMLFYAKNTDTLLQGKQEYIGGGSYQFLSKKYETDSSGMSHCVYKYELCDEYKNDSKALLDFIFSYCKASQEKYFTLKNLKNYDDFKDANETLTNEEAIKWLFEDETRRKNVYNFLYHNEYWDPMTQEKYFGSIFLNETCLSVINDKPVYKLRNTDSYSLCNGVHSMFRNEKGLFGMTGYYGSASVIQIMDEYDDFTFETPSALKGHKAKI